MAHIDYYFSVLSPFTYLAGSTLEDIASRRDAEINYRPFDIVSLFGRTGGVAPKNRHPSRQAYRLQDLDRISKLNGMKIRLKPAHWPTDPVPASCAILTALGESGGDVGALTRNILAACWAEDRDIALSNVVSDCLKSAGFDGGIANRDKEAALQQFKANTDDAVSRNVFGAPSYVVGDQVFWGQDRLHHLDAWLEGRLN